MNFFSLVDESRRRWNVLEHPFYVRWSAGGLSSDDLALYAGQYRHAVKALAEVAGSASNASHGADPHTRAMLEGHAQEEAAHVEIWDDFAASAGADPLEGPLAETQDLVASWVGQEPRDLNTSLAVLYTIEVTQPNISNTKLAGLVEHYGYEPETPGTEYFELHGERDIEHAAQSRALLETRIGCGESESLAGAAESALSANWRFLDGVERQCELNNQRGES